jgi:hypothetical protein
MPSFWLPPNSWDNGLAAERWAEIIVVRRDHADELLRAFRSAEIAACAAPAHLPWSGDQDTRVWVDPDHYAAAENVLLREMSRRTSR